MPTLQAYTFGEPGFGSGGFGAIPFGGAAILFGTPGLSLNLTANTITPDSDIGYATIALNLTAQALDSLLDFGLPYRYLDLAATGIASADAYGQAALALWLRGVGIPTTTVFGRARVRVQRVRAILTLAQDTGYSVELDHDIPLGLDIDQTIAHTVTMLHTAVTHVGLDHVVHVTVILDAEVVSDVEMEAR